MYQGTRKGHPYEVNVGNFKIQDLLGDLKLWVLNRYFNLNGANPEWSGQAANVVLFLFHSLAKKNNFEPGYP